MKPAGAEADQTNGVLRAHRQAPWWMWVGAAALMLMSVYSAWDATRLQRELKALRDQARIEAAKRERMRVELALAERERMIVADPSSVQIAMPATQKHAPAMHAYWHAELGLVVAGVNIPAPPKNLGLQLWLIPRSPGNKAISAGMLEQRPDGVCSALVPHPPSLLADTKLLAITEEPVGGSSQPTSAPRWMGTVGG